MRTETPAKVNLFLELGRRRKDGYHEIISLVEPLDLCDTLEFSPGVGINVRFDSPWKVDPYDNTVVKAAAALSRRSGTASGVDVCVRKRIPAAAGLGGGSSDAACVLNVLNRRWRTGLDAGELAEIAAGVGSDVALFLRPGRCVIRGMGRRVKPVVSKHAEGVRVEPKLWYFLAVPDFPVSTREVYAAYDRFFGDGNLTGAAEKIKILCAAMVERDVAAMERAMFNRLEPAAEKLYGQIREVKEYLRGKYGKKFMLSGSGGTLYAVFAEREGAERLARSFRITGWRGLTTGAWIVGR